MSFRQKQLNLLRQLRRPLLQLPLSLQNPLRLLLPQLLLRHLLNPQRQHLLSLLLKKLKRYTLLQRLKSLRDLLPQLLPQALQLLLRLHLLLHLHPLLLLAQDPELLIQDLKYREMHILRLSLRANSPQPQHAVFPPPRPRAHITIRLSPL